MSAKRGEKQQAVGGASTGKAGRKLEKLHPGVAHQAPKIVNNTRGHARKRPHPKTHPRRPAIDRGFSRPPLHSKAQATRNDVALPTRPGHNGASKPRRWSKSTPADRPARVSIQDSNNPRGLLGVYGAQKKTNLSVGVKPSCTRRHHNSHRVSKTPNNNPRRRVWLA